MGFDWEDIGCLGALGILFIIVLLCIFGPVAAFFLGWVGGYIIKIFLGSTFCKGLALLGIVISENSIPLLCGTLSLIGRYFKSSFFNTNKNNKNNKK